MSRFTFTPAGKNTRKSVRPSLEALEGRDLMAVSFTNTLCPVGEAPPCRIMNIAGTVPNPLQSVVVREDHDANIITVIENNGAAQTFPSAGITEIRSLRTRSFRYELDGSDFEDRKTLRSSSMPPGGTATFDLTGGTIEAKLDIDVTGYFGVQQADILLGKVDNADVSVRTDLKWGNDIVNVTLTGDLEDDADVTLFLTDVTDRAFASGAIFPGGDDRMTVTATADVDIDDSASLNATMNGVDRNDTLVFDYDGEVDGVLFLRMNGGRGADTVDAAITLDDGSDGFLDAIVRGFIGADLVEPSLIDDSDGDATIVNAQELAF